MANPDRKSDGDYVKKYREKQQSKRISIDLYLSDPVEQQLYESWQKEENKKQLFMKLYIDYLAKQQNKEYIQE